MINEHQKRIIRQTVDEVLNEMLDRRYLCENEEDEGRLSNLLGAAGIAASTMFGSGHANATNPTIHNGNRNIEKPSSEYVMKNRDGLNQLNFTNLKQAASEEIGQMLMNGNNPRLRQEVVRHLVPNNQGGYRLVNIRGRYDIKDLNCGLPRTINDYLNIYRMIHNNIDTYGNVNTHALVAVGQHLYLINLK